MPIYGLKMEASTSLLHGIDVAAMKLAILNLMFLFGCMTSLIAISSCQPPSPVQGVEESALIQLYRRLESDLPNPRVRPLLNSTQDLMVNLSASLFQLVDVVSCTKVEDLQLLLSLPNITKNT